MANNNEELKKTTELSSNKEQPSVPPQASQKKERTKSKSLIPGITIFFSILALIMSLFALQTSKQDQNSIQNENQVLVSKIAQLKKNQKSIQKQIRANTDQLQEAQNSLQTKIDFINKDLQQSMGQKQDWLLLKARYYLELAQINAHWSNNYNTSIALLQQADLILKQLSNPKLFEIRQIIAKEIAQLKAIPGIDITGLLSQLDAAQINVNTLTIQARDYDNTSKEESNSNLPQTTEDSSWRKQFQNSVNLLEKLVVIRRNEEPIQPILSPLYESLLKESITIHLKEAQWAVLNNNPEVYQLVLKQAVRSLEKTFSSQAPNTAALLKQLKELQHIQLDVKKPEVGLALPQLNQLIDNKELLVNQENTLEQGAK